MVEGRECEGEVKEKTVTSCADNYSESLLHVLFVTAVFRWHQCSFQLC